MTLPSDARGSAHPEADASQASWAPGPTWLLRRDRILRILNWLPPGRLLEVGCGAGGMLVDFARLGHRCEALETSHEAVAAARRRTASLDVTVVSEPSPDWREAFDYVVAFEVLEHIEDDRAAVAQWVEWLRPGGRFLASVPAHARRWNASDEWAGHFRRYERAELVRLLGDCGLDVWQLDCYGFPLSNLVQPIRARIHRREMEGDSEQPGTRSLRTARSGVERSTERRAGGLLQSLPGRLFIALCCQLQRPFVGTELGNNYLAHATRREGPAREDTSNGSGR